MTKRKQAYYIFKFCLLGQGGVGKTCIVKRLCFNKFDFNTSLTIGVNFYSHNIPIIVDGAKTFVTFSIWDFGGKPAFKNMFHYYIGGANGIFLVFDLHDLQTLLDLGWWHEQLKQYNHGSTPKIVIGAKSDLVKKSEEKKIDLLVNKFVKKNEVLSFFKTSSKNNINIKDSFKALTRAILEKEGLNYDRVP